MGVEYPTMVKELSLSDQEREASILRQAREIADLLKEQSFQTVVVLGCAGAGKSTLVERVAPLLGAGRIMADEVHGQNPFFGPDKTDRKRWALSSNMWFLTEKFKLIQDAYIHNPEGRPLIMDSGLTMGRAYARLCQDQGLYTPEEYQLFRELSAQLLLQLPQPDIYLRLNMEPSRLRERILSRGRSYEIDRYTEEYLSSIVSALDKEWGDLQKSGSVCLEYDL